jgi:DNA helicase-2/ATP-dependent DNA helicase PcrA
VPGGHRAATVARSDHPQYGRHFGSAVMPSSGPWAALTGPQRHGGRLDTPPPLCIVAGAGSGKTRVLTLRIARRIQDGSADADHTAVCTFTRKAARELANGWSSTACPCRPRPRTEDHPGPASGPERSTSWPSPCSGATPRTRGASPRGGRAPLPDHHRIVGDPAMASAVDTEIGWAKAGVSDPDDLRRGRPPVGPPMLSIRRPGGRLAFAGYEAALVRRRSLDLDDVLVRSGDLIHGDAASPSACTGATGTSRWTSSRM